MLTLYTGRDTCLVHTEPVAGSACDGVVWFDLVSPTAEEDRFVERQMGVSIPTRDEALEIETSSRLYEEGGALYMTAVTLCQADSERPGTTTVTFILAANRLATVRYEDTRPFSHFEGRALKPGSGVLDGTDVLLGLTDSVVDRVADVLERVGAEVDQISSQIFAHDIGSRDARSRDYGRLIRAIARQGHTIGKTQESLVSFSRLLGFFAEQGPQSGLTVEEKGHITTLQQDIKSISDYATALDNKVVFLLDATLGLVGLEQNTIVKIFSVLAVVFMPPTLIASIYGMNFRLMPELDWTFGYPMALGMMLASVLVTYTVFKWRGWL
ncbi:magnesium transporter CorA family protein [Prosthecomicrobium sp. N25]|uniref:magnesium transporter CorA family protein n=1 Tax=Prosthecomicrobium sp. N25 TaxID=3129254 RepID=UPI0030778844